MTGQQEYVRSYELRRTAATPGWRVAMEILDQAASDLVDDLMNSEDSRQDGELLGSARGARRLIKQFRARVSALSQVKNPELQNQKEDFE